MSRWIVGGAATLVAAYTGTPIGQAVDDVRLHRDSLAAQEVLANHRSTVVQHPALAEPVMKCNKAAESLQNLPITAPRDMRYALVTDMQGASQTIYEYSVANGCETDFSRRPKGSLSQQMEYSLKRIHEHAQSRPQPVLPDEVISPSTAEQPQ